MSWFISNARFPGHGLQCPYEGCENTTKHKCDMLDHVNAIHIMFPNFPCPQCPQTFYTQKNLNRHVKESQKKEKGKGKGKSGRRQWDHSSANTSSTSTSTSASLIGADPFSLTKDMGPPSSTTFPVIRVFRGVESEEMSEELSEENSEGGGAGGKGKRGGGTRGPRGGSKNVKAPTKKSSSTPTAGARGRTALMAVVPASTPSPVSMSFSSSSPDPTSSPISFSETLPPLENYGEEDLDFGGGEGEGDTEENVDMSDIETFIAAAAGSEREGDERMRQELVTRSLGGGGAAAAAEGEAGFDIEIKDDFELDSGHFDFTDFGTTPFLLFSLCLSLSLSLSLCVLIFLSSISILLVDVLFPNIGTRGTEIVITLSFEVALQPIHVVHFSNRDLKIFHSIYANTSNNLFLTLTFNTNFAGFEEVLLEVTVNEVAHSKLQFKWTKSEIYDSQATLHDLLLQSDLTNSSGLFGDPTPLNVDQLASAAHSFGILGNDVALRSLAVTYGVDLKRPWSVTGQTILHVGLLYQRAEVVRLALESGLPLESKNRWGVSAKAMASSLPPGCPTEDVVLSKCI